MYYKKNGDSNIQNKKGLIIGDMLFLITDIACVGKVILNKMYMRTNFSSEYEVLVYSNIDCLVG